MSIALRIILAAASVLFLFYVTNNVRKGKLLLSYSLIWMLLSLLGLCGALVPIAAISLASFFGFEEASNFVFFILLVFVFVYLFYLSMQASKQEKKIKNLVQELALDRYEKETTGRK